MFDPEFLEMMPLTCSVAPRTSTNGFGEASYGTAVTPHCHIQYTGKLVVAQNREDRYEVGVCFLDGVYPIDTTWSLTVPKPGGGTEAASIISVDQNTDEDGWHHTALHFGAL